MQPVIRHERYSQSGQNTLKHGCIHKMAGILITCVCVYVGACVCVCKMESLLFTSIQICLSMAMCMNVCVHGCGECVPPYGTTICPVPVCNPRPAWQRTQVFLLYPRPPSPDPEGSTVTELSHYEVIQKISTGPRVQAAGKHYQ